MRHGGVFVHHLGNCALWDFHGKDEFIFGSFILYLTAQQFS